MNRDSPRPERAVRRFLSFRAPRFRVGRFDASLRAIAADFRLARRPFVRRARAVDAARDGGTRRARASTRRSMLRASLRRDDARARDGDAATTSRGGRRGRDNERRDGDDAPELGALDALPRDVRIHALSFCAADALATLARMGFGEDAARAAERRARRRGAEETPRRGETWIDVLKFVEARERMWGDDKNVPNVVAVANENATTTTTRDGRTRTRGCGTEADDDALGRAMIAVAGHACVIRVNHNGEVLVTATECANDEARFGRRGSPPGMFGHSSAVRDELRGLLTPPSPRDFGGPNARVVQLALGRVHALALTDDGKVWSWGGDAAGQCGHGRFRMGEAMSRISLGGSPTAGGGRRKSRTYGGGSPPPHQSFLLFDTPSAPRQIVALEDKRIAKIRACRYSSGCQTIDGRLYCFGDNRNGNLGLGDNLCVRDTPVLVATIDGVVDFDMGAKHTLAVTTDGALYSWGDNSMKQLGRDGPRNWPAMAIIDVSDRIVSCAAGGAHSACLTDEGELFTWGSNDDYACGHVGSKVYVPQKLEGLPKLVSVSAGTKHVVGVDETNRVWGFGSNKHGQLKPNERGVVERPTILGNEAVLDIRCID
jgi:hypothetical protein